MSKLFQSTPPARAATERHRDHRQRSVVSIHAARAGGDIEQRCANASLSGFNPRRPRGRRRSTASRHRAAIVFQSTPPARAATLYRDIRDRRRAGFNPRRPRGRRHRPSPASRLLALFQSTPPARAATKDGTLRRVRHLVSIHAARAGGDQVRSEVSTRPRCFNPRRPRGRRPDHRGGGCCERVSIHAARAGGDLGQIARAQRGSVVSIHAARAGGDGGGSGASGTVVVFQSTPPARAATVEDSPVYCGGRSFNPRRPRGRRRDNVWFCGRFACFNPRRPRGRRPGSVLVQWWSRSFNPRRPRGRRHPLVPVESIEKKFQSTPPARAATQIIAAAAAANVFQSTPPARAAT